MPLLTRFATQLETYLGDKPMTLTDLRLRRLAIIRRTVIDMAGIEHSIEYCKSAASRHSTDSLKVCKNGLMIVESRPFRPYGMYALLIVGDKTVDYEEGNEDDSAPVVSVPFDRDQPDQNKFLKKATVIATRLAP